MSLACGSGRLFSRFLDGENLVGGDIVQHLMDSAWPADFNVFDPLVTGEAKVNATIARGGVADRGRHFVPLLAPIFRGDMDLRSDSHAIAFGPHEF